MKKYLTKPILSISFLLIIKFAAAQIVYTDIEDVYVECRKGCLLEHGLDLNNDG